MKTSLKKALSFFMAVAVMLSCITITPVSVSAGEELPTSGECGVSGNNVTWNFDSATGTLTISGTGAMADYIPDDNDPEWVTNYRNNITKIVIGYGITRIGNDSFYGCDRVEEVVFERNEKGESSITSIGEWAFQNCNFKEITIPASVETIGSFAFRGCIELISVTFEEGSSLTSIGEECFFSNTQLEQLVIPSKVKSLGNYSVGTCSSLKHFYYPSIVNNFGTQVFYFVDTLEYFGKYTVNETAKTCSVQYIGLDTTEWLPKDTIVPSATEIVIPEKLDGYEVVQATIGDKTVAVPKNFEADHKIAKLSDIEALKGWTYEAETDELPVGGSVEVTATYQVKETQKLTKKITISRSACADTNKDHKCDGGCGKVMSEHTWDGGVVSKEPTALAKGEKTYTCTMCKETKKEEMAALGVPKKGAEDVSDDGEATYKVTKSDLKKGTVTYVAPSDKSAATVTIPATVEIDGVTFKVTAIEKNAFKNNKKVKKVTIGKNVTKIGSKAFYGCSKLKNLTIKSTKLTAKKISSKAFAKTPKNMKVTVPKKKFKSYKSMLIKKGVNKKAKFKKK